MSRKVLISLVSVLVLVSLGVMSCGAPAEPGGEKEITRINIAAGSPTGVTTLQSSAISGILKKYVGVESTVLNYPSRLRDISVGEKETQMCISTTQMSHNTFYGLWPQGEPPYPDLREMMPTNIAPMQIWVPVESPVKTFRDLVGKTAGVGTKAMSSWDILNESCPALGLDLEKDLNPFYSGHPEAAAALVAGKIDVYFNISAPPQPTFAQTDLTRPLRLIGFNDEDIQTISEAVPGMTLMTIPPNYYHMDVAVNTVGTVHHSLTLKDFPEDIVYGLVKNTFENPDYIGYYFDSYQKFLEDPDGGAKHFVETYPVGTDIPFHKGAVRAFQDLGLHVPPERIPPEMK